MGSNKSLERLEDIITKLCKQATDSLVGQVVLIELLEEKGILTKEEYKKLVKVRESDIMNRIASYLEENY